MRILRKQWTFGRAAVTIAAACLLLLQTMVAGVAAGASFSGADSDILRLVCSTDKTDAGSKSDPQAPASHHVGACCILHNEAAIEPDAAPVSIVGLAPTPPSLVGLPSTPTDAIHAAPELAPQSARAPPLRFV